MKEDKLKFWKYGGSLLEGTTEETCHEEWEKILDRMIFLLREASEDTCTRENPYEPEHIRIHEEFTAKYGLCGEKLMTDEEKLRVEKEEIYAYHSAYELPEYKEAEEKFFAGEVEIAKYRENCKDEALKLFSKYFFDLWD